MASVDTGGGSQKKGRPKKINTRVDFTPMVDVNMLLIIFFMFCTTLSKPQVMDIAMPMPDVNDPEPNVKESTAITILLGDKNKVYYYTGKPHYDDWTTLQETTFATDADGGIRDVIAERNAKVIKEMRTLKSKRFAINSKMSDEEFREQAKDIRANKEGQVVVIKPTPESTYKNLVDVLDEMQICSIGRYAIVELAEGDKYLLENFKTKGAFGASVAAPK